MTEVLLNPDDRNSLVNIYKTAFENAEEIYLATAFLTDWSFDSALNKKCKRFVAVIGTNFGLTRKNACYSLLKWLPKKFYGNVFAFPQNENTFHPKIIVWKQQSNYFALIGSSNLTNAALFDNYEINSFVNISRKDYERIVSWLNNRIENCDPISKSWLENFYREAKIFKGRSNKRFVSKKDVEKVELKKVSGYKELLKERRNKQKIFKNKKSEIIQLLKDNAHGNITNATFWTRFQQMWHMKFDQDDCFRFQGSGIERTCTKKTNWKEVTSALLDVIDNYPRLNLVELDELVSEKIDFLRHDEFVEKKNPARKSWFSEMLCQFFPERYPVLNAPVNRWIKKKNWSLDRGGTEGQKYIDLARRLRTVVRQNSDYVKNLAEIDTIIWKICPPKKKSQS